MNTITKPILIPKHSNSPKNILETNFNGCPIDFSPPNDFMLKINKRLQQYDSQENLLAMMEKGKEIEKGKEKEKSK